jgi:hypothetical protein
MWLPRDRSRRGARRIATAIVETQHIVSCQDDNVQTKTSDLFGGLP